MKISTPGKIETCQNFILKFAADQFGGSFSPNVKYRYNTCVPFLTVFTRMIYNVSNASTKDVGILISNQ